MAIQVIESKKLPFEENLWLNGLSNDLNAVAAGTILEAIRKRVAELGAYLHALLSANAKTIREVLEMANGEVTLGEVGLIAKWEKRGEARGKKNGWEEAIGLLKQCYTLDQLERMSPGNTDNRT